MCAAAKCVACGGAMLAVQEAYTEMQFVYFPAERKKDGARERLLTAMQCL